MATTPTSAEAGKKQRAKVKALRVTARRESFRRAGRKFGADPIDIPLSELKKGEAEALKADKQLVVQEVEIDAADAEADGAAETK